MSVRMLIKGLCILLVISCNSNSENTSPVPTQPLVKNIYSEMNDNCQNQDLCFLIDSNVHSQNSWIPFKIINTSNQYIHYLPCPPRFEDLVVFSNNISIHDSIESRNWAVLCLNGFSTTLAPGDTAIDIYKENFSDTGSYCLQFSYTNSAGNFITAYSDTFRVRF